MCLPHIHYGLAQTDHPCLDIADIALGHPEFAILQYYQDVELGVPAHNTEVTFTSPVADEWVLLAHTDPPILDNQQPILPVAIPNLILDPTRPLLAPNYLLEQGQLLHRQVQPADIIGT